MQTRNVEFEPREIAPDKRQQTRTVSRAIAKWLSRRDSSLVQTRRTKSAHLEGSITHAAAGGVNRRYSSCGLYWEALPLLSLFPLFHTFVEFSWHAHGLRVFASSLSSSNCDYIEKNRKGSLPTSFLCLVLKPNFSSAERFL